MEITTTDIGVLFHLIIWFLIFIGASYGIEKYFKKKMN